MLGSKKKKKLDYLYLPSNGELNEASDLTVALARLAIDFAFGVTFRTILKQNEFVNLLLVMINQCKYLQNALWKTKL